MLSRVSRLQASSIIRFKGINNHSNVLIANNLQNKYLIRNFSNESFKETLKNIKKKHESNDIPKNTDIDNNNEEKDENKEKGNKEDDVGDKDNKDEKEKTTSTTNKFDFNPREILYKSISFVRNSREIFNDNIKIAWEEMTGSNKENVLERKYEQAESFKRKGDQSEEENEEEDENEKDGEGSKKKTREPTGGSSALVMVAPAKSYWEQMAQRLDAPIIREILKNAKV